MSCLTDDPRVMLLNGTCVTLHNVMDLHYCYSGHLPETSKPKLIVQVIDLEKKEKTAKLQGFLGS